MRRLRFVILGLLFLVVLCLPFARCVGSMRSEEMIVYADLTLKRSNSPYYITKLEVRAGAILKVESGTTIFMGSGGSIVVYGSLILAGSQAKPIQVTPEYVGESWKGVTVQSAEGSVSLKHVEWRGFQNPIQLSATSYVIEDVVLNDGEDNRLLIGGVESVLNQRLTIRNLSFQNQLTGSLQKRVGLRVEGYVPDLYLDGFTVADTRFLDSDSATKLIEFVGSVQNSLVSRIIISRPGCSIISTKTNRPIYVSYGTTPLFCHTKPLPIVFVPGLGTSINLTHLADADPTQAVYTGWRFLRAITPSYFQFMDEAKARGLIIEPAYYDWRLPADQIANQYLQGFIQGVKEKYKVPVVNVVAHSYGGLVARSYIQGLDYRGDVNEFIMLGTPNQGAVKAYPVWENADIPPDWAAFKQVILLYAYQKRSEYLSTTAVVRQYFGSIRDLLPTYPAIIRWGTALGEQELAHPNYALLTLNKNLNILKQRVFPTTYSGNSLQTEATISVEGGGRSDHWADGNPVGNRGYWLGDGTVLNTSAQLPGVKSFQVSSQHSELPEIVAQSILDRYALKLITPPPLQSLSRLSKNLLWFIFDCPITVAIRLPDGTVRSSEVLDGENEIGEVEKSSAMTWVILPKMQGKYEIIIEALADTEVRYWVDCGDITTITLKQNEVARYFYQIGEATDRDNNVSTPEGSLPLAISAVTTEQEASITASWQHQISLATIRFTAIPNRILTNVQFTQNPESSEVSARPKNIQPKNRSHHGALWVLGGVILAILGWFFRRCWPP